MKKNILPGKNMLPPNVSIIMSVYNDEKFLAEAIDSVRQQTYPHWELIIINDASTDHTDEFVKKYREKDSRIHVLLNSENKGQTNSLNYGISISRGDYIARLDSDDTWTDKDKLKKQMEFLLQHPDYGMVGSWAYTIDAEGHELSDLSYPVDDKDIRNYSLIESCFIHSSVLMRKSVVDRVETYNPYFKYAQDYDLWLKIGAVSKMYNIPEYMVYYRINPTGISRTKYRQQLDETVQIIKNHQKEYKHFLPAVILWNIRLFLPRSMREVISRNMRKLLFLHKYSLKLL